MTLMIIAWLSFFYMILWYKAGALFEPRDLWVGVFWDVRTEWEAVYSATNYDPEIPSHYGTDFLYVYVCLIPVFPIKLKFNWM